MDAAIVSSMKKLGYMKLKDEQHKIVCSFISGRDVFGVLPTGFGKSLCYACLPLIFDKIEPDLKSIIIVVTPLTAIMKDQVSFCKYNNNSYNDIDKIFS